MALPYDLAPPRAASLGLIVLEKDETLENEARSAIPQRLSRNPRTMKTMRVLVSSDGQVSSHSGV